MTDSGINDTNIQLLTEGYWYEELPPIIDIEKLKESVKKVFNKIADGNYDKEFEKSDSGYITKFKSVTPPKYIFNDGMEPITYFEFKSNNALREMQIPNIKYYMSFIYNTITSYDELYKKLYTDDSLSRYVAFSNSYLMFDEMFLVHRDYDGMEELVSEGIFAVKNHKRTGQLSYERNNKRYLSAQGSKLYAVKVDIESFFPNVYTHYLSKIKDFEPFKSHFDTNEYFDFLDYYNMKTNNNQTKGIAAGVFSSTVSAELLMLCVDNEINEVLGEDVEYLRYVDDMTFFSDSLEAIYAKIPLVQQVLNRYRLRINNNKTEEQKSIYTGTHVDIYEIKKQFPCFFFEEDKKRTLNKDLFYNMKSFIAKKYEEQKISEIKAFVKMLGTAIEKQTLILYEDDEINGFEVYISAYMLQLACTEPVLASRCYRVIQALLDKTKEEKVESYNKIIEQLQLKTKYINVSHHDSLLQIWHYYIISRYVEDISIKDITSSFNDVDINPLIVSCFIKEGDGLNKEVVKYIKSRYKLMEKNETEGSWMNTIMFSKWWLPLFLINVNDSTNYSNFFESNHFNQVYKDISKGLRCTHDE